MGRPKKSGLNYFPLDTDFFRDRKIKRLRRTFGDKGISIYLYLLTEIYRDKGFYVAYDEELVVDVANELGLSETLVQSVIDMGATYELFDERQYCTNRILTSKGIQDRYFEAKKMARPADDSRIINGEKLFTTEKIECVENLNSGKTVVSRKKNAFLPGKPGIYREETVLKKSKVNKIPPCIPPKKFSEPETEEESDTECLQEAFTKIVDLWNSNFPEGDSQRRAGGYIPNGFEGDRFRETWARYPTLDRFRDVFEFAAKEDFAWNFKSVLKLSNFDMIITKIKKSRNKPGQFHEKNYEGGF